MKQLNEHHSFTGMQRDMSISKHPSSFLYDAHNIRLTARGEDTLLTLTNERGPLDTEIEVEGTYLGHCLLGKYLVVFSTKGLKEDDNASEEDKAVDDYITRIDLSTKEKLVLYNGNLKFSTSNLIEAISSFENENVQKVYWTDGKNQPRVINIVGEIKENINTQFDFIRELALQEEVTIQKQLGASGSFAPGVIQYAFTYYNKFGQETNIFYTSPLLYVSHKDRGGSPEDKVENAFRITVANIDKSFDYLRIYSIQRTSLNAVPIVKRVQDISTKSDTNRSESKQYAVLQSNYTIYNGTEIIYPLLYDTSNCDHFVDNSKLTFPNLNDTTHWWGFTRANYPNLQIRTPECTISWGDGNTGNEVMWVPYEARTDTQTGEEGKFIVETWEYITPVESMTNVLLRVYTDPLNSLSFLDIGTSGDSVDPTELLYKGGESLIAQTIEQKDNTLFLGNIQTERKFLKDSYKSAIQYVASRIGTGETRTFYPTVVTKGDYVYHNQLTSYSNIQHTKSVPCGGFKRGDYYRCGIQFQYKDGRWSDPIFLNDEIVTEKPSIDTTNDTISVPIIKYKLGNYNGILTTLYNDGYRRVRPVVVFPSLQDRVTICQGVVSPALAFRNDCTAYGSGSAIIVTDVLKGQSSWYFRPKINSSLINNSDGTCSPNSTYVYYADKGSIINNSLMSTIRPQDYRRVEIQGHFNSGNKFIIPSILLSFHTPDVEFDDFLQNLNFNDTKYRRVGKVDFTKTFSDISIQTETPQASNSSYGFIHKRFTEDYSHGIMAGFFYEDYCINDDTGKIGQWNRQKSPYKWLVYPWQRNGSLTNDINRPSDKGTTTSTLKKKVISNLRYTDTSLWDTDNSNYNEFEVNNNPQVYDSDQTTIIKIGNLVYQGNIDTSLYPDAADGMYFVFGKDVEDNDFNPTKANVNTPFEVDLTQYYTKEPSLDDPTSFEGYYLWKTWSRNDNEPNNEGLYVIANTENESSYIWERRDNPMGEEYIQLAVNKGAVRMRYKSTPHIVLYQSAANTNILNYTEGTSSLPILEIVRKGDDNSSYYRSTMFGGTSEDALKANVWIPCGEPVNIPPSMGTSSSNYLSIEYSYGDTYFQRWDCLKTYPFSFDDINQIVEIGSFMLETRCNIDGRYDRNRGQISNLNMSPINFNLFNPVYNQIDNFFTYRILDESYYKINQFPNQITWTKEKKAGADVDLWTNLTLASTYDMDGSKGEVRSLQTWKDQIFCFQDLGISNILFNSRVQIPTSDGVPIEITNSYKVDGYRYISDGIGCKDKWTISNTPSGLYFADTKTNHLHHVGNQGIQDVTIIHNMSSWFNNVNSNRITKTLHDDVNHDLYVLTDNEALCYSEVLGNFISFMSYQGISLIESYENSVYTMKDGKLYSMFTGEYNKFFGENYEPWDFTFISNGIDNSLMDFDKVYSTIDYRMDMSDGTDYKHDNSLDVIRVYNEYQDTGNTDLIKLKVIDDNKFLYHKDITLRKKFRIWRIQIPRAIKSKENPETHEIEYYRSNDRIRNTWCKIKLGSKGKNNYKAVLHDLNVQYYL